MLARVQISSSPSTPSSKKSTGHFFISLNVANQLCVSFSRIKLFNFPTLPIRVLGGGSDRNQWPAGGSVDTKEEGVEEDNLLRLRTVNK